MTSIAKSRNGKETGLELKAFLSYARFFFDILKKTQAQNNSKLKQNPEKTQAKSRKKLKNCQLMLNSVGKYFFSPFISCWFVNLQTILMQWLRPLCLDEVKILEIVLKSAGKLITGAPSSEFCFSSSEICRMQSYIWRRKMA